MHPTRQKAVMRGSPQHKLGVHHHHHHHHHNQPTTINPPPSTHHHHHPNSSARPRFSTHPRASSRAATTATRHTHPPIAMFLLKPTGRFGVGVQDLKYHYSGSSSTSSSDHAAPQQRPAIAADNHVVARLYYPAAAQRPPLATRVLTAPLTWIRSWKYAEGYVSWGLRSPSSLKEKAFKATAAGTIFALGSVRLLPVTHNAAPHSGIGPLPVVVFSHGAASCRNTYSIICSDLASRGFFVAAIEHADGTACAVELATGEWRLLQGLGSGAALEAKCDYRVQECVTMARVLTAMTAGTSPIEGLQLSGASPPSAFKGLLDTSRMAVCGHSCGGATTAAAVAEHGEFKCGVALDPWWGLLPAGSPALHGWKTQTPLLVLGSEDWNQPGKMFCDGARQEALFSAASSSSSSSTPASHTATSGSRPIARGVPVAAAAAAAVGGGSSSISGTKAGGGVIHIVPASSGHASFCDLPFLISPWASRQLRRLAGGKPPGSEARTDPSVVQGSIMWSMHKFLQDHLPLPSDHPASLDAWQQHTHHHHHQQQQQQAGSSSKAAAAAASGLAQAAAAPGGPDTQQQQQQQPTAAAVGASGRADSLLDHLGAADENLIAADEQQSHRHPDTAGVSPPRTHSTEHSAALDRASDASLAAAAAAAHLPVQAAELEAYTQRLGEAAYLARVYV